MTSDLSFEKGRELKNRSHVFTSVQVDRKEESIHYLPPRGEYSPVVANVMRHGATGKKIDRFIFYLINCICHWATGKSVTD